MTSESDARSLRRPQRRHFRDSSTLRTLSQWQTENFISSPATANAHFASPSDLHLRRTSVDSRNIGRRLTLRTSDTGSLCHPQRRTGDFTNPSAMAEVYFLQWPEHSILSRILKSCCGVDDRTDLESDAGSLRHPQRRHFWNSNLQ